MQSFDAADFQVKPLNQSWAILHPQPKGVIFFIGGAFFGTFPTLFYRFFMKALFQQGYTIVAFPFRFSFQHWSIAVELAASKPSLRQELIETAQQMGYDPSLYKADPNNPDGNYIWIGHSLGCKYIALLELLTDLEKLENKTQLEDCIGKQQADDLAQKLKAVSLDKISLFNQPSILLDPVVSDLDNAIPFAPLRKLFSRWLRVQPSREETYWLIRRSRLFALTSILSFNSQLATETVTSLRELLGLQLADFQQLSLSPNFPLGRHLAVLGIGSGDYAIPAAVLRGIEKAKSRLRETL